eukprot:jgi/Picsp_1/2195/NSC_05659-R1_protein
MACSEQKFDAKRVYTVGVALKKEKARKHVRDELLSCAERNGIKIVVIDEFRPLEEQGPFDAILQKIRRREFEHELEDYVAKHPHVKLCDPPRATMLLRNRQSMLDVISPGGFDVFAPKSGLGPEGGDVVLGHARCSVPRHTVLKEGCSFDEALEEIKKCKLKYPIVAKSLWADGRPGSHDIAVIWSDKGIERLLLNKNSNSNGCGRSLQLPVLLEQYVNHGECLFKVYVLGDQHVMVTRPSLHLKEFPWNKNQLYTTDNAIEYFNRVSAYPRSRSWGNEDLAPEGHGVPTPPQWLWKGIANHLRKIMGLTLFNFDIIVPLEPPTGQEGLIKQRSPDGLIHLIDINYYPGVEKLPNSEEVIVQFLCNLRDDVHT